MLLFDKFSIKGILCAAGVSSAVVFFAACSRQGGKQSEESPPIKDNAQTESIVLPDASAAGGKQNSAAVDDQAESEETVPKEQRESAETMREEKTELGDYRQLAYQLDVMEVTDEDVENEVIYLMGAEEPEPDYQTDGVVHDGDIVCVTYTGWVNGVQEENLSGEAEDLVIGDGDYPDEFEVQLIGLTVGQENSFEITFADDDAQMPGQTVRFTVIVTACAQGYREAFLTDEWARENTEFETMDQLKAAVRAELEQKAEQEAIDQACRQLITQLVECSSVTLSETKLEKAVLSKIDEYKQQAEQSNQSYEDYIEEEFEMDTDAFEISLRQELEKQWSQECVIEAFMAAEQVDVSETALQSYMAEQAEAYGYENVEAFYEDIQLIGYEEQMLEDFHVRQVGLKIKEIIDSEGDRSDVDE